MEKEAEGGETCRKQQRHRTQVVKTELMQEAVLGKSGGDH